jgi:hypothetical protein
MLKHRQSYDYLEQPINGSSSRRWRTLSKWFIFFVTSTSSRG